MNDLFVRYKIINMTMVRGFEVTSDNFHVDKSVLAEIMLGKRALGSFPYRMMHSLYLCPPSLF
jgi:hypothetical protein